MWTAAFPRAAAMRDAGSHVVVAAGQSYGQGSSREHAAICPSYLGVRLVLAKSFERIHAANLANFGVLPLSFIRDEDYDSLARGDRIEILDCRSQIRAGGHIRVTLWPAPQGGAAAPDRSKGGRSFETACDLLPRQREILLAGGALPTPAVRGRTDEARGRNMKIEVKNPIVELDGDEMTRIIWQLIKERLDPPHLEIALEYYDLGLPNRDRSDDAVTREAAQAIRRVGVGVKCATITPDAGGSRNTSSRSAWPSPNGTIRGILDGTVFRKPILAKNIPPRGAQLEFADLVGRHAYGDLYSARTSSSPGPEKPSSYSRPGSRRGATAAAASGGRAERSACRSTVLRPRRRHGHAQHRRLDLVLRCGLRRLRPVRENRALVRRERHDQQALSRAVQGPLRGRGRGPERRARGRRRRLPLPPHRRRGGPRHEAPRRHSVGLHELRRRRLLRHGGRGIRQPGHDELRARRRPTASTSSRPRTAPCVATTTSIARGVTTSTNPVASIFAWTGAIRKRGELDGTPSVAGFADRLERATLGLVEEGIVTRDLVGLVEPAPKGYRTTEGFIDAAAGRLERELEGGEA